jgi:hypothetical protein
MSSGCSQPRSVSFTAIQYRRSGNAVADDKQLARIAKAPKRELTRRGINQHTLRKICRKEAVRTSNLAKALSVLHQWESERDSKTRNVG